MLHSHHPDEYPPAPEQNGSPRNSHRLRHHSHVHLKPAAVLDHIKIKVKQRRSSHHRAPRETPTTAEPDQKPVVYRRRRFHRHGTELETKESSSSARSRPNNHSEQGSDESSGEASRSHEKITMVIDRRYKEEDSDESVLEHAEHVDTLHEPSQSKDPSQEPKSKTRELTTLRMRDEDLYQIFRNLPPGEKLIAAFACAWRKDTFLDGRMFLTMNCLCFSTGFFQWEENLCIAYKDIAELTKEQTARALENAIKLRTVNKEEYLFASYVPREEIFTAVQRLWKNALLEKPWRASQMQDLIVTDGTDIDESIGGSEGSAVKNNFKDQFPETRPHSQSLSAMPPSAVESLITQITSAPTTSRAVSPPPEKAQLNYASTCPCESHPARTYVDRLFAFKLDELYELSFGENNFTRAYHELQKLTDYTIGEWYANTETGKRERLVSYKTVTQSILGSNTISCSEKQTVEAEQPGSFLVVSTEVRNEGMKYTDAFFVATRYCMVQRDAEHSALRISAEIKYIKSVNSIARAFIEKNANASIENGVNTFVQRLESQQSSQKNGKSRRKHASTVVKQHGHKSSKHKTLRETSPDRLTEHSASLQPSYALPIAQPATTQGLFLNAALIIGAILLVLHLYLCYKLYTIDRNLHQPHQSCIDQCHHSCMVNAR